MKFEQNIHRFSLKKTQLKMLAVISQPFCRDFSLLTHWGRVTHICVGKLTIIGSDNGLSPWSAPSHYLNQYGILLIVPLGINFSEILVEILIFSFKKMRLKVSSAKWRPFCLGLNVLSVGPISTWIWRALLSSTMFPECLQLSQLLTTEEIQIE